MSSVREATGQEPLDGYPTIFRYDYPDAIVGEWAVFWEVEDEELFQKTQGNPDDPTDVAGDAWIAMTENVVVSLDEMR